MGWVIRDATVADIEIFTNITEKFVTESPFYNQVPFDRGYYGNFLEFAFSSDDHIALICEKDGVVAGAILGMAYGHLYNPAIQVSDLGFFVEPAFRGSRAAMLLEKTYRQWARFKGAKKVSLGVTTGYKTAGAFYERLGYTYVGDNYTIILD